MKDEIWRRPTNYQSCVMETALTTDELRRLEQRVTDVETANTALRDDSDAQEQYSRRNCLLVHGIPEGQTDTTDAVLSLCNSQLLGLELNRGHIDRSHRLGYRSETTTLTKRRAELLRKARTIDGITSTWTIDGRIVCLLSNGRNACQWFALIYPPDTFNNV